MPDISKRIADLSPEKRLLFQRLHRRQAFTSTLQAHVEGIPAPASSEDALDKKSSRDPDRASRPANTDLVFDGASSAEETKAAYRRFYNAVSEQLDSTEFGEFSFFLNYGYVPDDRNPQYAQVELPIRCLNKNSIRLALEVLGDCPLMGRRVLDVGCGRGGTVHVIHKFFAAKHITGIDLSSTAISFCKNTHRYAQVSFLEADAEALPFKDDSFEVVTNVESSHSYPKIERFYSGVFHVLTANGYFLYTDVLPIERMKQCVACLEDIGFVLEREQDITANVLLSCDEIARTRLQAFGGQRNARFIEEFLSLPGSEVYEDMKEGRSVYKIFKLKKAQGGSMWQTT